MRHARNFNPEWGYLAPAPGFARTARVVLVAAAVGATAGAAAVFSLVDHSPAEETVAARTLVQPIAPAPAPLPVAAAVVPSEHVAVDERQPLPPVARDARHASPAAVVNAQPEGQAAHVAASESRAISTAQHPTSAAALAEAPAIADGPVAASGAEPKAAETAVPPSAKKLAKKPAALTWHGLPPQPPPARGPLALLRPFGSQF